MVLQAPLDDWKHGPNRAETSQKDPLGLRVARSYSQPVTLGTDRGRRKAETIDEPAPARHVSMTPDQVRGRLWAQRLKRVFKSDILTCEHCGGAVKVIASIEDS